MPGQRFICVAQLSQDTLSVGDEIQPSWCQGDATTVPAQQSNLSVGFKLSHTLGHRGLGDTQHSRRSPDAAFGSHNGQIAKLVHFHTFHYDAEKGIAIQKKV